MGRFSIARKYGGCGGKSGRNRCGFGMDGGAVVQQILVRNHGTTREIGTTDAGGCGGKCAPNRCGCSMDGGAVDTSRNHGTTRKFSTTDAGACGWKSGRNRCGCGMDGRACMLEDVWGTVFEIEPRWLQVAGGNKKPTEDGGVVRNIR